MRCVTLKSHRESRWVKEIRGALTYGTERRKGEKRKAASARASNRVFLPCSRSDHYRLSLRPSFLSLSFSRSPPRDQHPLSSLVAFSLPRSSFIFLAYPEPRRHAGAYSLIIHAFGTWLGCYPPRLRAQNQRQGTSPTRVAISLPLLVARSR